MKSKKILVIGSSNTDMTVKAEKLPLPGETVLGGTFCMGHGGKGANQAIAAKRLGGDVSFACKVGKDSFGTMSIEKYRSENVDISNVMYSDCPSGVALITVDGNAENSIVVASGANADISVEDIRNMAPVIASSSILLMQLEIPLETVNYVADQAWQKGKKVILNPAPAHRLSPDLFRHLYLITPNETEAEMISGVKITDESSAQEAARVLSEMGVENVIITLGSKGALVYCNGESEIIPACEVEAIDTTAAGDVFNGALVVALSEGRELKDAVRFACKASAISVTRSGAQSSAPYRHEVDIFN